jgi:hypothetical protein
MDDITPLQQLTQAAASGDVYLFAPASAYRIQPGNQEGTPLPLDEPQVDTAPVGLYIDYYLPSPPRTPVVIEIFSGNGSLVRRWSSAEPPKPVDPKSVTYTTHWIERHPVPAAEAGAHRFVWDFHENGADGVLVPPGTYTVSLGVNGKTHTRSAIVFRDPRIAASDADLRAQYQLARQIVALRAEVGRSRARAQRLGNQKLSPENARTLRRDIIGESLPANPDDSMGAYSHDFTSLLYLENAVDYLESAVESADAAPTPDMRTAYAKLDAIYRATLARLEAMER